VGLLRTPQQAEGGGGAPPKGGPQGALRASLAGARLLWCNIPNVKGIKYRAQ
jgi:hypothetical protein